MANFNRFSGYEYVESFADGKFLADQKGASSYHETGSNYYHHTAIAKDIMKVKRKRG